MLDRDWGPFFDVQGTKKPTCTLIINMTCLLLVWLWYFVLLVCSNSKRLIIWISMKKDALQNVSQRQILLRF